MSASVINSNKLTKADLSHILGMSMIALTLKPGSANLLYRQKGESNWQLAARAESLNEAITFYAHKLIDARKAGYELCVDRILQASEAARSAAA